MPRQARTKSSTGIYHMMLRGINGQEIFHEEEDSQRFLETVGRFRKSSLMKVLGWCLLGNQVHLLLQEGNEDLSVTIKRIICSRTAIEART